MALRDESSRDIGKLIADTGLAKEVLTLDGVLRLAEQLGADRDPASAYSYWVFYNRTEEGEVVFFGKD